MFALIDKKLRNLAILLVFSRVPLGRFWKPIFDFGMGQKGSPVPDNHDPEERSET